MDVDKLIARVKAILRSPKTEWPLIAQEPATFKSLYTGYIMILAAVSTAFGFLGSTVLNSNLALFGIERLSVSQGLLESALGYVLSLAVVFILARIIDVLAPSFGGQRDPVQALKTAAYTYTAGWIASVGLIIPFVGLPLLLVGEIYGIYLLYLGLPHTMKAVPERRGGYTAVIVMISVLLSWVIGLAMAALTGDPGAKPRTETATPAPAAQTSVQPNTDGPSTAPAAENAPVMSAEPSEQLLDPERLKEFAPNSLDGLQRESLSAQRTSAMGLQVSTVKAMYRNDGRRHFRLEITDSGGARAVLSILGWAGVDEDQQTSSGYKRSYADEGRRVHEQWDQSHNGGEYGMVVGERFIVRVEGRASSINALREAIREIDLAGLEELGRQAVH